MKKLLTLLGFALLLTTLARADSVVVFNEVMYHPATNEAAMEWVELRNLHAVDVDLSDWSISGTLNYIFPSNSIIKGGQHLVVARSLATMSSLLGTTNIHGPFTNRLDNNGGLLRLRNNSGRVMDEMTYGTDGDWPVAPDGSGVSLAKRDPNTASGTADNWTASGQMGGTPGAANFAVSAGFVPPLGLVSYWTLNDPSGSALDLAGQNHGTVGGGVTRLAGTGVGGAFSFNGATNAFVNVGPGAGGSFNVSSGITIEAVLMPGWSGTNSGVIFKKALPPLTSYSAAVQASGPVAYWRLGDATTTVTDSSGNARHGTATAGVLLNQASLIATDPGNNAMRFTGAERATINGFEKIGAAGYSVEFWIRPITLPTGCCQNLVGDGESAGDYFMMTYILGPSQGLTGAMRPHFGPANLPSLTGTTALQVNNTYHIVATWDTGPVANNAIIYINGQMSTVGATGKTVPAPGTTGNNRVYLGKDDRDTTDGTEILDEVALYNYPLSGDDVVTHYLAATVTNQNFDITTSNAIQFAFQNDGNNGAANPPVAAGPVLSFGLTVGGVYSELDMPLDGASGRPTLAALENGQPHHISATYNSATGQKAIYVDGTLSYSTTLSGNINANNGATAVLGNGAVNGATAFVGTMDEMCFWSRGLSGSEIAAHWSSVQAGRDYFTPEPVGAAARLAFNELSASTNAEFWLELINLGTNSVPLAGFVIVRDGPDAADNEYVFPSGPSLGIGALLTVTNSTLGFHPNDGDRLYLLPPARDKVLDALVVTRGGRARFPAGTGPFYRPSVPSPGGPNILVYEDDVVINEIMYHHALLPPLATNLPPRESPEAWIELFNRGGSPIDLSGWELDGGVRFNFAPGTTIAAGGYLVVADDAAYLRGLYPSITIVGNFLGRLSGNSDRIVLKNPSGYPVDEVRYHDRAPWPEYADGGGSSLELRDPNADNSKPESWADSNEGGKVGWLTNSYRMIASIPAGSGQPTVWADFIFGLLGPGECLIDDLSVIQNPTGSPLQLIANGNFSTGLSGWRLLGTHGRSFLDTDPENPGNSVLHLVATGPQEHMHNHVERTMNNQALPQNGTEYQISYRVKWLAGNNLLNTRLYFNRCARTIALPMPALNGTPGAVNSRWVPNAGPTFSRLQHQPVIPQPGQVVTVSVVAQDPSDDVAFCTLWWSANGGAWSSTAMIAGSGDEFTGTIPGFSAGTIVQFYVRAMDDDDEPQIATYPAAGTNSGALYQVSDGQANLSLAHNVRIVMTPANRDLMYAVTNLMSNDRLPGTVIFDESRAYYNCGIRLKGSQRGRPNSARVSFHLEFPADDLFRGVHPFMLVDRSGAGDSTSQKQQEMLIKHILLRAGDIPQTQPDICRVIAPNPAHTDSALLMPRAEDELLDTWFENGGDGTMWELELIYYPNAGTTNSAGYKTVSSNPNTDNVVGTDISDVGNDKEIYRYNFIIKNHRGEDNYAPFVTFAKTFSLGGSALEAQSRQVMDVDAWTRAFAMESLCGVGDSYTFGNNHNLFMYQRPSDGLFVPIPTDMDFSFNRGSGSTLIGDQRLSTIFNLTPYKRCFYGHVLDLIGSSYNTTYMNYWVSHYATFAPGQNYGSVLSTYMPQRITAAMTEINGAGGNAAFAISGQTNLTNSANLVTLAGTAPVQVKTIRVNGIEYAVTWTSLSTWALRVPIPTNGVNTLNVVGYDVHGQPLTNFSRVVTVNYTGPTPQPEGSVVINEIHYNPTQPDAAFVELINTSTNSFDLSGWRVNGLDYTFPSGSVLTNNGFLVLANNPPAYSQAYTSAPTAFDNFSGNLDDAGETLSLFRPGAYPGEEILVDRVRYESRPPWSTNANGAGPSLQLIDARQDNSRAGNWAVEGGQQWIPVTYTGTIAGSDTSFLIFMNSVGDFYIDDLVVVTGAVARVGPNLLQNGSFETTYSDTWTNLGNHINSVVTTDFAYSGTNSLHVIASGVGSPSATVRQTIVPPPATMTCTISFAYRTGSTGTTFTVRTRPASGFSVTPSLTPRPLLTPGTTNTVASILPAYDLVWLNEVQAENIGGIADNLGQREPWVELYNAGTNTISLAGYYLSTGYTALAQWAFPTGATLPPGGFKIVFCDGETNQTTADEWHASFRLSASTGSVAFAFSPAGPVQLLDYLNYTGLPGGRSYGDFPDGQPFFRQSFYRPTANGTNDNAVAPLTVFINEWMAQNNSGLFNTNNNNKHDDWFEVYNPGPAPADLSGYYLTDDFTDPLRFHIPSGTIIPAGGFLLVWADGEPGLNTNSDPALHVSFKLEEGGEAIGIFGGDGTLIDAITFGSQYGDISEGLYPDGPGAQWIAPFTVPTPRAPNAIYANRYPVLAPIADATAYVSVPFQITPAYSDPDVPPQMLAFTLEGSVPTNAVFNPGNGVLQWTPVAAQTDTTNVLTLRVTDNGSPVLAAEQTFTVIVRAAVLLGGITAGPGGAISFNVVTTPGKTYRVEYKNDLNEAMWAHLPPDQVASGTSLQISDNVGAQPQRFYHVIQLD